MINYTTNHEGRQSYPLLLTLLNIYKNKIIIKWKQVYTKASKLSTTTNINTLLLADDQVIIADSLDHLQKGVFTWQNTSKNFGVEISAEKSDMMAFFGEDPVRCKIIVDNKCLQQAKDFKYLSSEISYETEKYIQQKVAKIA